MTAYMADIESLISLRSRSVLVRRGDVGGEVCVAADGIFLDKRYDSVLVRRAAVLGDGGRDD